MHVLLKDLLRAFRSLAREPGSAVTAVLILALGIGLSGAMFTFIYGTYLKGLDISDPHRMLVIAETRVADGQLRRAVPIQNYVDWRERQTMFKDLIAFRSGQTLNVAGTESPIRLAGARVTANSFSVLGVAPALGRSFVEGDDAPGAPALLILSNSAWQEYFGSDPAVIGRDVRVSGETGTIIGVMPEGFEWPYNTEGWTPLRVDPLAAPRGANPVRVWGRLRDGATLDMAAQEMQGIARQLEADYPAVNKGIGTNVYTTIDNYTNDQLDTVFFTMIAAVVLVLLVACFNVGNLLLARATMRTREAGIRIALGASRWRVALPFATEALALSAMGALPGVGIAVAAARWFDRASPERPWFITMDTEWPTIACIVALTGAAALIAAVAPAIHLLRNDVNSVLKDESRGSSSRSSGRLARILVTAEVGLSFVVLVGAGLMAGSMAKLNAVEYPFETDRVLTARIGASAADYPTPDDRRRFWRDLRRELLAEPEIVAASLAQGAPYARGGSGAARVPVSIDGVDYGDSDDRPELGRVVTTPGFFETYLVDLTAGRDFRDSDNEASERVAIVNQPMVDRYFDGRNPIGRRFREGTSDTLPLITVIGVVPDLHIQPPNVGMITDHEPAGYYIPLDQTDLPYVTISALSRRESAASIARSVRSAVARVDGDIPIYWVQSQREAIDFATGWVTMMGPIFIAFGLAALFMASFGLYGVLSFGVARRTSEMGIRMALGSDAGGVQRLVVGQGIRQMGLGLALGVPVAFVVAPLVQFLMYGIEPRDPWVFGAVLTVVLGVGVLASWVPARRATAVDPIKALRAE